MNAWSVPGVIVAAARAENKCGQISAFDPMVPPAGGVMVRRPLMQRIIGTEKRCIYTASMSRIVWLIDKILLALSLGVPS